MVPSTNKQLLDAPALPETKVPPVVLKVGTCCAYNLPRIAEAILVRNDYLDTFFFLGGYLGVASRLVALPGCCFPVTRTPWVLLAGCEHSLGVLPAE